MLWTVTVFKYFQMNIFSRGGLGALGNWKTLHSAYNPRQQSSCPPPPSIRCVRPAADWVTEVNWTTDCCRSRSGWSGRGRLVLLEHCLDWSQHITVLSLSLQLSCSLSLLMPLMIWRQSGLIADHRDSQAKPVWWSLLTRSGLISSRCRW